MRVFMLTILLLFIFTGCNAKTNTNITTNFEGGILPLNTPENTLPLTIASPQLDISQIDLDNNQLLDNITDFCSSPRKSGTTEEDQAVNFLVSKMSEYGYQSTTQIFNTYKKNMSEIWGVSSLNDYFYKFTGDDNACYKSKNIIATKSVEGTGKTLYLTAHFDTEKNIHGIRDNGSGVTILLEIARQIRNYNLPINIAFVFFGSEESGLQGSTNFVAQLSQIELGNAIGCINIDTVCSTEDTEIGLWTCNSEINALSLQMDKLHQFVKNNTLYSDHFSFYMRGIPAICLMDNEYNVNDSSNIPLEEVDITKLKELTQIICEFIVNFNVNEYKDLLISSHTKQYFEIPKSDSVIGYSVVQIDKILREDGAGSYIRYILENKEGNQVSITAQDTKFFDNTYFKKVNSYENYNEHVKYKVTQKNNMNKVEYQDDWLPTTYNVLEGEISVEDALDLLNNQNTFTNYGTIIHDLN